MTTADEINTPSRINRYVSPMARKKTTRECSILMPFMMVHFCKKRVLVTGANRGIGLALAKELNNKGAFILGTCRKTSEELSALSNAQIIENCEITDENSIVDAFKQITEPVDIVINNAGILRTVGNFGFNEL